MLIVSCWPYPGLWVRITDSCRYLITEIGNDTPSQYVFFLIGNDEDFANGSLEAAGYLCVMLRRGLPSRSLRRGHRLLAGREQFRVENKAMKQSQGVP
jgi:hypothetical protein